MEYASYTNFSSPHRTTKTVFLKRSAALSKVECENPKAIFDEESFDFPAEMSF